MPLRFGLTGAAAVFFSCCGIYMAFFRHRTARLLSNRFYLFALLYVAWSCGLTLWRSEDAFGDRQLGYSLLIGLFAFAGPGMVLVANPMRFFVVGARIGVAAAVLATIVMAAVTGQRVGLGGNPAVSAFVVALAAIAATMPLAAAPRWLPNGPQYLVAASLAVILSQTRSVIAILLLFALVEVVRALWRRSLREQLAGYAALLTVVGGMLFVPEVERIILDRWVSIAQSYLGESDLPRERSSEIRLAMWSGSHAVILEHPLLGVGSEAKMQAVVEKLGERGAMVRGYIHVHNLVLDELLNHGVPGLALLLAMFLSAAAFIWRRDKAWHTRRCTIYFLLLIFAYGMLHNPLLHEATLAAIFLHIGAFNASIARSVMAERRRPDQPSGNQRT